MVEIGRILDLKKNKKNLNRKSSVKTGSKKSLIYFAKENDRWRMVFQTSLLSRPLIFFSGNKNENKA